MNVHRAHLILQSSNPRSQLLNTTKQNCRYAISMIQSSQKMCLRWGSRIVGKLNKLRKTNKMKCKSLINLNWFRMGAHKSKKVWSPLVKSITMSKIMLLTMVVWQMFRMAWKNIRHTKWMRLNLIWCWSIKTRLVNSTIMVSSSWRMLMAWSLAEENSNNLQVRARLKLISIWPERFRNQILRIHQICNPNSHRSYLVCQVFSRCPVTSATKMKPHKVSS